MKTKTKNQYQKIKQLESEIAELKIKQHTEKYIHFPKVKIGLILLFILVLSITYGYSFIFINEWKSHNISFVFSCDEDCNLVKIDSLGFLPQIIFAYLLISLVLIYGVATIKGSFSKLKKFNDTGLIWGLISGLILGLIWGLIGEFE